MMVINSFWSPLTYFRDMKGIEEIFDSTGRRPRTIRTDKGSEFVNAKVKTFLEGDKILHSVTQNEVKANYVEVDQDDQGTTQSLFSREEHFCLSENITGHREQL